MNQFLALKKLLPGLVVFLLVAAAASIPMWGWLTAGEAIVLQGEMAESGGWTPASLNARVGEPLDLRLTSRDVMHSFAIGQHPLVPVDIQPGEVSEVTVTFDRPGKYTFYCTRWCGPNHWRMRGVIEVSGPGEAEQAGERPLYVELGLDIDAPHPAAVTPAAPPSAPRGAALEAAIPAGLTTLDYYRTHSPAEIWQALRQEPSLKGFSDLQIWDLTAALIQAQTTPQALAEGQALYVQNCAACHGEEGEGDGVFADELAQPPMAEMPMAEMPLGGMPPGAMTVAPVDYTDPNSLLGASPAVLQGKIVRGGMGTGMPYWGPIFTDEQTWALVAYIQSLHFEMENQP